MKMIMMALLLMVQGVSSFGTLERTAFAIHPTSNPRPHGLIHISTIHLENHRRSSSANPSPLCALNLRNRRLRGDFDDDYTEHEEDSTGKIIDLKKENATTFYKIDGVTHKTTVSDYPMKWKSKKLQGKPGTTHEITFDMHNGFDQDHFYVTGLSKNSFARISKKDPTCQQIFEFENVSYEETTSVSETINPEKYSDYIKGSPHTLRFFDKECEKEKGMLWVGLENWGIIVKLNMTSLVKDFSAYEKVEIKHTNYTQVYDVRIFGMGNSTLRPINTRPHGFCFDEKCDHIYFTGKLTNTVGRVNTYGTNDTEIKASVQHFELPTLGAVPIYVALGPDNNIWGTCLSNNIIFQIKTNETGLVTEVPIDMCKADGQERKPIAIQKDPKNKFMWFSTQDGHSICRLDTDKFNNEYVPTRHNVTDSKCVCSPGCKTMMKSNNLTKAKITYPIIEFQIPKKHRHMILGGLAFSKNGDEIWTQSKVDNGDEITNKLSDYIIKICLDKKDRDGDLHVRDFEAKFTGNIEYFRVPTKNTLLHRIVLDQEDKVWFTELGADRVGTLTQRVTQHVWWGKKVYLWVIRKLTRKNNWR